ncbi:MAG: hypothetical protein FWC97_09675 [Treponema sp.]|nr:hypothetical protein [Treponema sp.]
MKKFFIVLFFAAFAANAFAELRSFDQIFPEMSAETRALVFSDTGFVRTSQRDRGFVLQGTNARLEPQIINMVLNRSPRNIVESISIIPRSYGTIELLEIFNALGNIRDLQGRLYHSHSRDRYIPLFEEATRIVSERQTTAIPDPPPATTLPRTQTVFLRLRDANFGNTFYRGEMVVLRHGLRYTLTNFRNMTYLLVPVIREDRFIAQLYFEPIKEGVLIYGIAGVDIADIFASRIGISSAIAKRLEVIIEWAVDGITSKKQIN